MIVVSHLSVAHTQSDGSRDVVEIHQDHLGVAHRIEYRAPPGTDHQAVMQARARQITEALKARQLWDIEQDLLAGRNPFPPRNGDFPYCTRAEALTHLFERLLPRPAAEVGHLAPLLALVGDAELAQLGYTAERINALRVRCAEISALLPLLGAAAFGVTA